MNEIINLFERIAAPLKETILQRRIKLLKAEARKKTKKAKKHEKKLILLELKHRELKEKYKFPHRNS